MNTLKPDDRVEMTEAAIKQGLDGQKRQTRGIVLRIMQDGRIRVKRDGVKAVESWHADYWRNEMQCDLAATERDIARLEAIVVNLREFMAEEPLDRRYLRLSLMQWEKMRDDARELRTKISAKLAEHIQKHSLAPL